MKKFKRTFISKLNKLFRIVILTALICGLLMTVFTVAVPEETKADYVTDTLSVKVGYSGMELDEYVELGTFYWGELEEMLEMHEVDYSYFSGDGTTDESGYYNSSSYNSIISTGYGFYVMDLLSYLKIYYGDIYNVLFYVNDHNTIWTALDSNSLFQQRYYFEDLPGHREVIYNGGYQVMGYNFSSCWEAAYEVQPMLALESNWDSINEEAENHYPNYDTLSTSTRFRLLYGQTSPTERITRESAEYVSCIYVTLNGTPTYGEMPEMDTTIGSHTVEVQVSADNESIRDALSELMNINSTNEEVLTISGYTLTPVDGYSDLAILTISYEVYKEGDAGISVGVGRTGTISVVADTDHAYEPTTPETETSGDDKKQNEENETEENGNEGKKGSSPDPQDDNDPGSSGTESSKDSDNSQDNNQDENDSEPTTPEDSDDTENSLNEDKDNKASDSSDPVNSDDTESAMDNNQDDPDGGVLVDAEDDLQDEVPEITTGAAIEAETVPEGDKIDSVDVADTADAVDAVDGVNAVSIFEISRNATNNVNDVIDSGISVEADRNITQLVAEDNSEEEEAEQRMMLILTGLGCLAVLVIGCIFGLIKFKLGQKVEPSTVSAAIRKKLNGFFFGC